MSKIFPNSDPLTSVFIPYSFEPKLISTKDKTLLVDTDFTYQFDTRGRQSIIKLNRFPYIDLYNYDHDRKRWYYIDEYGNRFSVYTVGDYDLETNSNMSYVSFNNKQYQYQAKGVDLNLTLLKYSDTLGVWGSQITQAYPIVQYSPISISINSEIVVDKTDYSGNQKIVAKLDEISPTRNRQFYYDFNGTIFTNQDFGAYDPTDIIITYYVTIDNVSVKCRMSTNSTALSNKTPMVDYYVLKLIGQNL